MVLVSTILVLLLQWSLKLVVEVVVILVLVSHE